MTVKRGILCLEYLNNHFLELDYLHFSTWKSLVILIEFSAL